MHGCDAFSQREGASNEPMGDIRWHHIHDCHVVGNSRGEGPSGSRARGLATKRKCGRPVVVTGLNAIAWIGG